MAEAFTAQIIPFPRRAEPAKLAESAPAPAPQQLTSALTSLSQSMAQQREAVAAWRNAVKDLATQMQSLSDNLASSKLKIAKRD